MTETVQQSSNPFVVNAPRTAAIKELRQIQIDALKQLWEALLIHKRVKFIGPVGIGKSLLAMAMAEYFDKIELHTLITSPLNELVEQYNISFKEVNPPAKPIFTLKGRKWYPCMAGKKDCSKGYCRHDECSQGLGVRECRMQNPPIECSRCKCPMCVYPPLIKRFRGSEIANTNFSMFLLGITNNPDVIILDEADMGEDFIRMHYSVTVEGHLSKDFDTAIKELQERADYLRAMLEEDDKK